EELIAPLHWRTVDFLSDLHLQATEPETLARFGHYLASTQADALFMLGDLFEVWVGDDACDEPGSFEATVAELLAATARQRPVYFMHGNRDFLVGASFFTRTGVVGLADPTLLVFQDQRLLLSHGDLLCLDDVDYQRFRVQARSSAWQEQFLSQPLATRRDQARAMRAQSEARKRSGEHYADVDGHAALAWLQACGAHTLVHGHTHRPAAHTLAPGYRRLVLSDWDFAAQPPRADVLRATDKGLERIRIGPM
ncbi:MAG: UDP-2,3-diacylglucosamine diphosphatase, partial [Giesbergeria sp.]